MSAADADEGKALPVFEVVYFLGAHAGKPLLRLLGQVGYTVVLARSNDYVALRNAASSDEGVEAFSHLVRVRGMRVKWACHLNIIVEGINNNQMQPSVLGVLVPLHDHWYVIYGNFGRIPSIMTCGFNLYHNQLRLLIRRFLYRI